MIRPNELDVREKAAQLLFPRLGSNMPPPVTAADDEDRFKELLGRCPVGGLIVFNGQYPQITDALKALQRESTVPLLVCADLERGVGQQIRGATVFPHAMAFSQTGDPSLVERAARVQAREALGCGIHITFSPVADVNIDPRNPIIATRAYSSDAQEAARLVSSFVAGCHSVGVLCAAKHFPGHGNTAQDSHSELPVVRATRRELDEGDLVPFRAAIEAGVDLIMSAHVVYPTLDPDRPATLSPSILRGLLRDELGFTGAVVTDSLLMGAINASHSERGEQAATLVAAGVDILLDIPDPIAAVDGITRAVERGALDEALLDEAVERVFALKRKMMRTEAGAFYTSPTSVIGSEEIGSAANGALAERVAQRAVTIVDDRSHRLPIDPEKIPDPVVVLVKPHRTRFDPDEEPFLARIRELFPGARTWQVDADEPEHTMNAIRESAAQADLVVAALVVKPAAWHAFGLRPEQSRLVDDLLARAPTVVVSLGSPYVLDNYHAAAARLCAFSDIPASQHAAADRLVSRQA